MDDARQKRFLGRVRAALAPPRKRPNPFAAGAPDGFAGVLARIARRTSADGLALLERMKEAAGPLKLEVATCADTAEAAAAIARRIRKTTPEPGTEKSIVAWKHPLVESLHLPQALAGQNVPVRFVEPGDNIHEFIPDGGLRRHLARACMGVTSADFCLADTATLVMKTRPCQPRSVSLLPTIHVAVVRRHQLLADLFELYAVLDHHPEHRAEGLTNYMSFITGPSKTADIEMTLVHGVHGPREMAVYVLP